MKSKMDIKKLLVSFVTIASILLLVVTLSASTNPLATVESVKVKGISDAGNEDISVVAGEMIPVEITFKALQNASDVRIEAELQGTKSDSEESVFVGDVEVGKRYSKIINIRVPYELQDEVSDNLALNIRIKNEDFTTTHPEITLRVQRPAYNAALMSITTPSAVEAGKLFPVDIVLKNTGYNRLNDVYVTARISEIDIEKTAYFGDIVALEDDDNEDLTTGRLFLEIPFTISEGTYALEVTVENDDTVSSKVKQIVVENTLESNIIADGNEIFILNPTSKLMVLRLVPKASNAVSVTLSESLAIVPAGSSKTITASVRANAAGTYSYDVDVFSAEGELLKTLTLSATADGAVASNSFVALASILTIVFFVLLIVLIILVTRKPAKAEELGESYY